jgi:hypothetical protein
MAHIKMTAGRTYSRYDQSTVVFFVFHNCNGACLERSPICRLDVRMTTQCGATPALSLDLTRHLHIPHFNPWKHEPNPLFKQVQRQLTIEIELALKMVSHRAIGLIGLLQFISPATAIPAEQQQPLQTRPSEDVQAVRSEYVLRLIISITIF